MPPPVPASKPSSGGVKVLHFMISAEGSSYRPSYLFFYPTEHFISSFVSRSALILVSGWRLSRSFCSVVRNISHKGIELAISLEHYNFVYH